MHHKKPFCLGQYTSTFGAGHCRGCRGSGTAPGTSASLPGRREASRHDSPAATWRTVPGAVHLPAHRCDNPQWRHVGAVFRAVPTLGFPNDAGLPQTRPGVPGLAGSSPARRRSVLPPCRQRATSTWGGLYTHHQFVTIPVLLTALAATGLKADLAPRHYRFFACGDRFFGPRPGSDGGGTGLRRAAEAEAGSVQADHRRAAEGVSEAVGAETVRGSSRSPAPRQRRSGRYGLPVAMRALAMGGLLSRRSVVSVSQVGFVGAWVRRV